MILAFGAFESHSCNESPNISYYTLESTTTVMHTPEEARDDEQTGSISLPTLTTSFTRDVWKLWAQPVLRAWLLIMHSSMAYRSNEKGVKNEMRTILLVGMSCTI